MFDLLWTQKDAFAWNFVDPFGYFYTYTFPLVAIGFLLLIISFKNIKENAFERWLLLAWTVAAMSIGVVHPVNLTRLNLIFIPALFCAAICLVELDKLVKYATPVALVILSVAFIFFNLAYHGNIYQKRAEVVFNAGIIPAIEYAVDNHSPLICVTEQTRFAYIYALYVKKFHPSEYLSQIEWLLPEEYPLDPARTPRALGEFRFRLSDCVEDPDAVYVLTLKETPPNPEVKYKVRTFTKYLVFTQK
jgi:hypothetical protein